ncbi:TIGR00269 family protein [Candidatus Woesearchaeota archaeon]|nr:TIGR00269 family protein [Candidatus Woesearchaeota archaeon]
MKCEQCSKTAISTKPALCKEHFDEFFLTTTQEVIDTFSLFDKKTNICVAVSGGKDSLALVDVLLRLGYPVEGLFIDEGIANYREHSIQDLDLFTQEKNFQVNKISFKEAYGFTLDQAMQTGKVHACTVCGTFRRQLLNKHAQGYDVIATGHNMDDEAQTILINLARGNTDLLFRLGPITKDTDLFVRRAKPFYFLSEKHILTYTILRGIRTQFGECPYAQTSYRAAIAKLLNEREVACAGTKRNILETYLQLQKKERKEKINDLQHCKNCGEPSQEHICKACLFKELLTPLIK